MDRRVQRALDTVDQNLASDVTAVTLAADVNLSPSRFAHLFRCEVGASPTRFIRAQRMIRAYLLLTRTFLTVKEVMVRVGCNDASHFSRDFRRFHGFSPSATRRDEQDAYSGLMAELLTGRSNAAIPRVAAMANERFGSPTKDPAAGSLPGLTLQIRGRGDMVQEDWPADQIGRFSAAAAPAITSGTPFSRTRSRDHAEASYHDVRAHDGHLLLPELRQRHARRGNPRRE